ncbi:hypothetical protein FOH10_34360 [Nocardia otitidiscaviarum]|uniref:Uncharacterized protein n=1 Tax=Nocardia otitidiscaviarum TaxID=1823 RepID=A0A516NVW0_9NOCA|nr:hypothetical protein [Nocardia otitidiscaviarum]MCP9622550.1 hypothetical protein [Nocardia otitidiscaviarum]QDP83050.1 hypothetical protein FOH10_34360 [Nocardia otitidiscaviarum]
MTENPNTVYDDDVMITMRGIADSVGLPHTVNPIEHVDREMLVELRQGPTGPVGPDGAPAWPWEWQGDVDDFTALQTLRLTTADARKAWRVVAENAVYYWTGLEFIAFDQAFGKPGARGRTNRLTGSAVAGPVGSAATARLTGIAPEQHLEITFPRGETGPVGEPGAAGRIQDAADVSIDVEHPLGQDYVLSWNADLGKFQPVPSPRLNGPWAIGQGQINGGTSLTDATKTIAAITIPSQPMSWRPVVEGWISIGTDKGQPTTRCDIEVRIGSPEGELVARGHGSSSPIFALALIAPEADYPLTPDSAIGVVPANQTVTLYVSVRRTLGTGRYSVRTSDAQVIVYAQPV